MSTVFFLFNYPPLAWPDQGEIFRKVLLVGLLLTLLFVFNHAVRVFMYHWQHLHATEQQLPPEYRYFLPCVDSIFPFLLNNAAFLRLAT